MTPFGAPSDPPPVKGLPFGWRGVGIVLAVILGASVLLQPGHVADGPTICQFRRLTGRPCPGCGLTRSFTAMGSGDLTQAFLQHPFGPLLFLGALALLAAIVWRWIRGSWPVTARQVAWVKPFSWGVLAVWLVWAAARAVGVLA